MCGFRVSKDGFFGFPARGGDRDVLLNVSLLSLSQHLTRSMDMASSLRSYESRKKSFRMNRQKSLFEFLELFIVVVAAVLFCILDLQIFEIFVEFIEIFVVEKVFVDGSGCGFGAV